MNVLVTGVRGFIGSALCPRLLSEGMVVRGSLHSDKDKLIFPGIFSVSADLLAEQTSFRQALYDMDVVIHLAAHVPDMKSEASKKESLYHTVNVQGTERLAREAAIAGVKRFIFLSSIKVNGEDTPADKPFTAADEPKPQDSYALSKWEAEQRLAAVSAETGLEVVIIRPPLVYGPNVKGNFLTLLRWTSSGLPLPLGAINNKRSLIGLDNLVDFIVTCIRHPAAVGQTFLVSDGEDLSTTALITQLGRSLGKPVRFLPVPASLLKRGCALLNKKAVAQRLCNDLKVDMRETEKVLQWKPPASVHEGLQRVSQWYLETYRPIKN